MLSDVAAERVKWWRDKRGLTREQLAKRCEDLGWSAMTYGVLGTIETGRRDKDGKRRREITVDELVVLAHALNVPPVLLVAPLGYQDSVEVLPGHELDTLSAYEYLSGGRMAANTMTRADYDRPDDAPSESAQLPWFVGTAEPALVIRVYREHRAALTDFIGAQLEGDREKERKAWTRLQIAQRTMQEAGWRIPPLPGPDDDAEL